MARWRIAALVTVVAACAGTTAPEADQGPTTSLTTLPTVSPETSTTSTTTSATPAPTSSTSPPTTSPPEEGGRPVFALTRIGFGLTPQVVVTNVGAGPGNIGGYWLSKGTGSFEIPRTPLAPGESIAVGAGEVLPDVAVGVVAVVSSGLRLGDLEPAGGEMALYRTGSFDVASEIVDYVEWGSSGHNRSEVAVKAGIWPQGGVVRVRPLAIGLLATSAPAGGPDAWLAEIGG
jgi:hypothetical protein